jgi:hypothetical protein
MRDTKVFIYVWLLHHNQRWYQGILVGFQISSFKENSLAVIDGQTLKYEESHMRLRFSVRC